MLRVRRKILRETAAVCRRSNRHTDDRHRQNSVFQCL